MSPTELFVGAWRLVSWERRSAAGEVSYLYGREPAGQLIYTANGQMSAQLMNRDAKPLDEAGSDSREATAEVAKRFFAYWGRYTVDESTATVTHHVLGGLARSWVSRNQIRRYEFSGDDRLTLTADLENDEGAERAGFAGAQVLVWERIR
jgi:anaerobic glycerol-3-phosphate dehydrogenase